MFSLITFYDFVNFKMTGILANIDMTMWILLTVLFALIGYLIGSVNFSVLISKIKYHDDVRNHGSHNAGATNMLRSYSVKDGEITLNYHDGKDYGKETFDYTVDSTTLDIGGNTYTRVLFSDDDVVSDTTAAR